MKHRLFLPLLYLLLLPFAANTQLIEIRSLQKQLPAIKDSVQYINALNRLGTLYGLKNLDTSFYYAQKALPAASRIGYEKGHADALTNLGTIQLLQQNTYLASIYFNKALKIYNDLHDTARQCLLLNKIGVTLVTDGRINEFRQYITEAFNIGKTFKHDSVFTYVLLNLVNDAPMINEDSASQLLTMADAIVARYNDTRGKISAKMLRAELLIKHGQHAEVMRMLHEALAETIAFGDEYEGIALYEDLGDACFASGDSVKAVGYYKTGLDVAEKNGYRSLQLEITKKLYDYFTTKGDKAMAASYGAMLIKSYQAYQQAIRQNGIDYMDYFIKTTEVENLKDNNRRTLYIIIALSILFIIIAFLLFFVLRARRIERQYVELLRKRNEEENARNAELQYRNEFNNRLISLLAHDFRQPLAAVKGMMSLLKLPGSLSEDEIQLLVNKIEKSSDTSLDIFDNILQWIKKQVTGFVYEPEDMPLSDLIAEAARSLHYTASHFNITIANKVEAGTTIRADREMLQFVNRNLVHNAIKFSPEGSTVTVSAAITGNEIIVSIKDEGKGMTEEKISSLFNIFSKTQYASDKEKGSGVALVICRDFLERMHGRIWAVSEPGKGSAFMYALPLVK